MYKFILENAKGDQLTFNEIGGAFTITEIDGLNPPRATINTSEIATIDGQMFDGSKLEMRTLNVAFAIERNAAANRIEVFKVLKTKQPVKAYFTNAYRDVYINGYVESLEIGYYDLKQIVTVAIVCPRPYWQGAQDIVNAVSQTINAFHFPFASTANPKEILFGYIDPTANVEIVNLGDVRTGLIIELYANAAVSDPKIIDYMTGEYIELDFDMQEADTVIIDTRAGEKTVTLLRDGQYTNIFNSLVKGSTWLQLDYGGGVYTYEVGGGNAAYLTVRISHTDIYEGV